MTDSILAKAPLGHDAPYPTAYDPTVLFPIARQGNRQTLAIQPAPAWHGADIWNAYELSWLNLKGKPVVATGCFVFSQASPCIIESKSFKLYLNSFNEGRYENLASVQQRMQHDLSDAAGAPVEVRLNPMATDSKENYRPLAGINIDGIDVDIDRYTPAPELLRCMPQAAAASEVLVSDLLKSNCPVTGQPDWGSLQVSYSGPQMDRAALLKYIISLRRHNEFHEHCVERMYCDIWQACRPSALRVYARYTRRGGLDINPWRASVAAHVDNRRTVRQ
ncbi:MAG: NADPH-dependent 7-cyano-7-deazaguanine reductase QueF [Candidimonas sp.]|nr:MAG: NADPH-dependent 7-cyano-7-deazaguanine reductase QueF [Candidimonas sp.]TAM23628.1 MAG: NADPH-dependent 7-cyano-7-deazaguanine reductase QueF [Candidimonas sp.]TAM79030.1 MAG: NADPH-dependent 7-cyano-7-deazaguanine reductase QueF [Candidimonas sp.]